MYYTLVSINEERYPKRRSFSEYHKISEIFINLQLPFFLETDDGRYDHSVIFGLEHLETILASEAARFIWDKISFETGCDLSFETKNVMSLLTRHWTYYTGEFVPYYEDDHKLLDSL